MIAGPLLEPVTDQPGLVRAVVVQHQMDVQIDGNTSIDAFQKIEKLQRAMAAITVAQHLADLNPRYTHKQRELDPCVGYLLSE